MAIRGESIVVCVVVTVLISWLVRVAVIKVVSEQSPQARGAQQQRGKDTYLKGLCRHI